MTTRWTIDIARIRVSCRECSLAELCLPRSLSGEEVDRLDAIAQRGRALDPSQRLFEAADAFESLYVVRSGSLKSSMSTPEGLEQIVGFHLPGELVGLDAFHAGVHHCSAQALETTSVCGLPIERLEELCVEIPSLSRQMHALLGREIAHDQSMLLLLGKGTAEERLAAFVLSLSRRYEARGFSATRFNLTMSRHDIGNYLGLALETVSRQFAKLQSRRVLSVNRRELEIHDLEQLQRLVGECREQVVPAAPRSAH
jgi:CRP/FNR family transcriptional regulator